MKKPNSTQIAFIIYMIIAIFISTQLTGIFGFITVISGAIIGYAISKYTIKKERKKYDK